MRRPSHKIQGASTQGLHSPGYRKQEFELHVQSLSFEQAQLDGSHSGKIRIRYEIGNSDAHSTISSARHQVCRPARAYLNAITGRSRPATIAALTDEVKVATAHAQVARSALKMRMRWRTASRWM